MNPTRIQVDLLGRPGCHLCDEACDLLLPLQEEFGFRIVKVDISKNLELLRLYRNHIPVALVGDFELFRHRVDVSELRKYFTKSRDRNSSP